MLEFDGGQLAWLGLSFGAGPAQPPGRPEPEPLIAAREGLERPPRRERTASRKPLRACRTSSWAGLLPSAESCLMIAYVRGSNSPAKPPIEAQVIARHHVRGEPLLEHPAHDPAVELVDFSDRPHRLVFAIDDESGFPVLDDLGDGSAARDRPRSRRADSRASGNRPRPDPSGRADR